ncbi:MAG: hypothetical protein MJ124_06660 [Lachnospiraceae bacterium]|nr:hypothetical protein [Lachnospiraceae bacterium]
MGKIDEYDYDAQYLKNHPLKVGFCIGFKSMALLINRLVDETGEVTSKYPKSELLKLWGYDMGIFFFVFLITYKVLTLAALPFYFFYGFVLVKLFIAWKKFKYSLWQLLLMTLVAFSAEFALAAFIRSLIIR